MKTPHLSQGRCNHVHRPAFPSEYIFATIIDEEEEGGTGNRSQEDRSKSSIKLSYFNSPLGLGTTAGLQSCLERVNREEEEVYNKTSDPTRQEGG